MLPILLRIIIFLRDGLLLKTLLPILVTPLGIDMLLREVQPSKADSPMAVKVAGSCTLVIDVQPKNA